MRGGRIIWAFITLVLMAATGYGVYRFGPRYAAPKEVVNIEGAAEKDAGLELPGEVEKTAVTISEVRAKINEIGELTTCEGKYTVTRGREFTRYILDDIPLPGTTNTVEITCSGVVKAGYDLNDVRIDIDEAGKKIYIALPEPQINSNEIIWGEDMTVSDKNNILNPIDFDEYRLLIPEIKSEGLKIAEEEGLYSTVRGNAEKLITNFLGCFEDYTVEFM